MLLMVLLGGTAMGQRLSHEGTDFWVAFLPGYTGNGASNFTVRMCMPQGGTGTLSNPATGWTASGTCPVGGVLDIAVPAAQGYQNPTTATVSATGIHVTTTSPATVYAYNRDPSPSSLDATLVLPTVALGTEYLIQTYPSVGPGNNNSLRSDFAVVAVMDSTEIDVTLSSTDHSGSSAPRHLMLHAGQVARFESSLLGDFTASMVVSNCKPVAVFQGNRLVQTTTVSKDHNYHQAYPLMDLGMEYVVVPAAVHDRDIVRVTSTADGCVVQLVGASGTSSVTLDWGMTHQVYITDATMITATAPVAVAQYYTSRLVSNEGGDYGDVAYVAVAPTDRGVQHVDVSCFAMDTRYSYVPEYYVNVVAPTAEASLATFDGAPLTGFASLGTTGYSYLRKAVTNNVHTLSTTGNSGLLVTHYGLDENWGAYYLMAGLSLDSVGYAASGDTVHVSLSGCDSVTYRGMTYDSTGVYVLAPQSPCGPVEVVDVVVNPSFDSTIVAEITNEQYPWAGTELDASGTYEQRLTTVDGCDSTLHLHLVVHHVDTIAVDTTSCGSVMVAGRLFSTSGRFEWVEANGDDTTYRVVNATIYPTYDTTLSYELINDSLLWIDGQWYSHSTTEPTVTYTTVDGCDSTLHLNLVVHHTYDLWVPNAFTPDLEENNRFRVFGYGLKSVTVTIFQRWGDFVTQFDGLGQGWDGTHNGWKCPMGSYVYRIDYEPIDPTGKEKPIVGTVTLIR